jgi:hypothetical protein
LAKRRFKRGDVVRVIASPPLDHRMGPSWNEWMAVHCGRVFVISGVSTENASWLHLRGCDDNFVWHWHPDWLLPASKCQLVCDRLRS